MMYKVVIINYTTYPSKWVCFNCNNVKIYKKTMNTTYSNLCPNCVFATLTIPLKEEEILALDFKLHSLNSYIKEYSIETAINYWEVLNLL